MARHGKKTTADALLVASLATGATHEEAAKAAGVSVRTVARRMADPVFRRRVDQEQDALLERFVGGAANKLGEVLDKLGTLVQSGKELIALGACRTLAELLLRVRESASLSRRMAALENAADEPDDAPEEPGKEGGSPPDEPRMPEGGERGSGEGSESGEDGPG